MIIDMHTLLALLALFVLVLQMHTDMGAERGIRLRCMSLGDAALRGSRMSARGPGAAKARSFGLPDPLSLGRSF